jgi:hypothetical protein
MERNQQLLSKWKQNGQAISLAASIINFRIDVNFLFSRALTAPRAMRLGDFATGQCESGG